MSQFTTQILQILFLFLFLTVVEYVLLSSEIPVFLETVECFVRCVLSYLPRTNRWSGCISSSLTVNQSWIMSQRGNKVNSELEDLNFLKSFTLRSVSSKLTLEEEERAANSLVREALHKSKQYQKEHNYVLPDHLEQFRLEYEKAEKKKVSIPLMSQLTPRTKRELSTMPRPTYFEEQKANKLVELSRKTDKETLYNSLIPAESHEAVPRYSELVKSTMVMIPNNISKEVDRASTNYFETMEYAKTRKQEQDAKLARLFDKYSTSAVDEAPRAAHKDKGSTRNCPHPGSPPQAHKKSTMSETLSSTTAVVPKSVIATASASSAPTAVLTSNKKAAGITTSTVAGKEAGEKEQSMLHRVLSFDAASIKSSIKSAGLASLGAVPTLSDPAAALREKASSSSSRPAQQQKASFGFSLSKSLSLLSPIELSTSSGQAQRGAAPKSAQSDRKAYARLPPQKMSHQNANNNTASMGDESEALVKEHTPILYSMLKAHSNGGDDSSSININNATPKYNATEMSAILAQRYNAENERLQRVMAKLKQKSEQEYLNLFSVKVLEESGLDLNKEYNRVRNYTIYLMQLSYHFYIQRMRSGFTHLHSQVLKERALRIKKASLVVLKTVKLGVYIITMNERKRKKEEQRVQEQLRLELIEKKRVRNFEIVYRSLFYFRQIKKIRHLLQRRRAATRIQKRVRGNIGREKAHKWKVLHAYLSAKALMIQCAYRSRLARRKVMFNCCLSVVFVVAPLHRICSVC